jgi:SAM-dependent methyltransferase
MEFILYGVKMSSAMNIIENLRSLYAANNKHDNYQNLPDFVQEELGFNVVIDEQWRGDSARYKFLLESLDFKKNETVVDIGANTGFFTLSFARKFPDTLFVAYEINPNHVEFIQQIVRYFEMKNVRVNVLSVDYAGVKKILPCDFILNFNVLHHAGVDFDKGRINDMREYFEYCSRYLNLLSEKTGNMVFQMGYNWGGNKQHPIVPVQNDLEKIIYSCKLFLGSGWSVKDIALCKKNGELEYHKLPPGLLKSLLISISSGTSIAPEITSYMESFHFQELSEFYRRPIFILNKPQ